MLDVICILWLLGAAYVTYTYPLFHTNLKILVYNFVIAYTGGMTGRLVIILYQLEILKIYSKLIVACKNLKS